MNSTNMHTSKLFLFLTLLFLCSLQHLVSADELKSPPDVDNPVVSPDGENIIFEFDDSNVRTTIWIANRDGSDARPLVNWPESIQKNPDWSPDGKYIVFSSNRDSLHSNIWRIDADGGNPMKLTNLGENYFPRFSPDGTKILYTKRNGNHEIWFMSINGNEQQKSGIPDVITIPRWSPDSNSLVYSKCEAFDFSSTSVGGRVCNLFIYNLDTGSNKQITFGKSEDESPDWGAPGIIFISNRNSYSDIWIVDETGDNIRQITETDGLKLNPRWDYITDTIVFSKAQQFDNNIWSVDIYGEEIQLTSFSLTDDSNQPPVANAGEDRVVECTSENETNVTLDGTLSYDPDNDQIVYEWTGSFGTVIGVTPTVKLPIENNLITLNITDGENGVSVDTVMINVVDTTPPSIHSVSANPASLWPPNHKMIPVSFNISSTDICSSETVCKILSVSSNEPVNGLGDGDTEPDWEIKGNLNITLRAERSGSGSGRIYTITIQCLDISGNSSVKNINVTVPINSSH